MKKFNCKEMDPFGTILSQTYEAENTGMVMEMIRNKGNVPISIEAVVTRDTGLANKEISFSFFKQKVKLKDVSIFCKQMSTMLAAGMPILNCLDVMSEQSDSKRLREVCSEMMIGLQKGEILSSVMSMHKSVFPAMLIDLVKSGELTGRIDEVFAKMSEYYANEVRINAKIKNAMMYPIVLAVITLVVVVFMLVKILPTFADLFKGAGAELPGITLIVLGLADVVKNFWYIILAAIIIFVLLFKVWKSTPAGRRAWDAFILKIPVIANSLKKIYTARFTRTLATLTSSGIQIIEAVSIASNVTQSTMVMRYIDNAVDGLQKGNLLSDELNKIPIFPSMMTSMISIGEESGALDDMLEKTADYYDQELEAALTALVGLIEPVMIVLMAIVIGFMVVAMMMPMFDMIAVMG